MKLKDIFTLALIVLVSYFSNAQIHFTHLDEELETPVIDIVADGDNNIYALQEFNLIGYRTADLSVLKWNGLFWTKLTTLRVTNYTHTAQNGIRLAVYNNEIYIIGSFKGPNNIVGAARWDGKVWNEVGGGLNSTYLIHDAISVEDVLVFNNELYVVGDFNQANSSPVLDVAVFNGSTWNKIDVKSKRISHLQRVNDTLYMAGDFTLVGGISVSGLAAYTNNQWSEISAPSILPILGLASFQNDLVAFDKSGIFTMENGNWKKLSTVDISSVSSAVELNGSLFLSGSFANTSGLNHRLLMLNNDSLNYLLKNEEVKLSRNIDLRMIASEDGRLFIGGGFYELKGSSVTNIAVFKPGSTLLNGIAFQDDNGNCSRDNGEELLSNLIISLNAGSYYTSTDELGRYQLFLPPNSTNTLEIFDQGKEDKCKSMLRTIITASTDDRIEENFALQLKPEFVDVDMSLTSPSGMVAKHGFNSTYSISFKSEQPGIYPVHLSLRYDERLKDLKCAEDPTCEGNGVISWVLNSDAQFELTFRIDPSTIEMGEILKFNLNASQSFSDEKLVDFLNQTVVAAYDPNDKQCDKSEITTSDKQLNYHIRFQNIGSASATNVHVVDTIDGKLPIEYLQMKGNSHGEKYSSSYKVRGHALIWSFNNIQLPSESSVGTEKSSGYLSYEAGLSNDLFVGQEITNKAYIYFDFQPPVVTNTTLTKVVEIKQGSGPNEKTISIYPNPAVDKVTVKSTRHNLVDVKLYGIGGQALFISKENQTLHSVEFNVNSLPSGVYFIRLEHALGIETLPFVVSQNR